ncbi:hypothetical protein ASPZODRAFT_794491 [Penicilliopsis zonata CBS 506.65]|uniref:Xylanolytic transcriptional activator regulatory domain-containing protein n=1 Tax=Penicilliopsis zonata CBS 506.65 TaxID=1073090 RepID=A0A1L9SB98_9EURO|nr:hypothetical protein ASPZODRAFT_794491 [Penicilliopsis zonata CBS 506.65]OJJ44452.1 hypothetical protein ASPZODRAFT_794491 [Penicilliopsis zonata CBS 506.65]
MSTQTTTALRASICAAAVASLSVRECLETFHERRDVLLQSWQDTTRAALVEAGFLRNADLNLLAAQLLLLTSMLDNDPNELWSLFGTVLRLAQSQGLHRDGEVLGLKKNVLESEMRRRVWWYLVTLDARLAELVGADTSSARTDTRIPLHVNDADLAPDMQSVPPERAEACDMTFCRLKYEIAQFTARKPPLPTQSLLLSQLEGSLEARYLRSLDPVDPVQFLSSLATRSSLCKLRQATTLSLADRTVAYDNLIHASPSLARFLWHVRFFFPWGAPVFTLQFLAAHPDWDAAATKAFNTLLQLYAHHPEFLEEAATNVTGRILGGLMLKAWAVRESFLKEKGGDVNVPATVEALQVRQAVEQVDASIDLLDWSWDIPY